MTEAKAKHTSEDNDCGLCQVKAVASLEDAQFIARQFIEEGCFDVVITHGLEYEVVAKC